MTGAINHFATTPHYLPLFLAATISACTSVLVDVGRQSNVRATKIKFGLKIKVMMKIGIL
jgi:hypothetical protein